MEIKIPIKIHNRFEIEVKDVTTGEVVQRGKAENIILDNLFGSNSMLTTTSRDAFYKIDFGKGAGALLSSRTTLFNKLGNAIVTAVETVINQQPLPSYATYMIVIPPSSYVGETITEVGFSNQTGVLVTHALIKDSEGNPLTLGPKTSTQEITIYGTIYATATGGNVDVLMQNDVNNPLNYFLLSGNPGSLATSMSIVVSSDKSPSALNINYYSLGMLGRKNSNMNIIDLANKKRSTSIRFESSEGNGKIYSISYLQNTSSSTRSIFRILLPNLIFPGYEFDKRQIGVGTGSQTIFNLTPWDEARIDKTKAVYIDNTEQASGVTWGESAITFDTAPVDGSVITADYWVDYIPKDVNHVLDVGFSIILGEGSLS